MTAEKTLGFDILESGTKQKPVSASPSQARPAVALPQMGWDVSVTSPHAGPAHYALTPLGSSLSLALEPLLGWARAHAEQLQRHRRESEGAGTHPE